MATGGESSTSVDMSQVLQSICCTYVGSGCQVVNPKRGAAAGLEQKMENDRLSKRIKLVKKFGFRKKENQIQHKFNESVAASMEEAAASLEKKEDLAKMKEALQEGLKLLTKRQKIIKITVIISPANSFALCAFPDWTLINRATHCH